MALPPTEHFDSDSESISDRSEQIVHQVSNTVDSPSDSATNYGNTHNPQATAFETSEQATGLVGGSPEYHCCHPGCAYATVRYSDLKRHMHKHYPGESFSCPYTWCGRDVKPFSREDHLKEHLRNVHMQDIPKREKGRRARKEK